MCLRPVFKKLRNIYIYTNIHTLWYDKTIKTQNPRKIYVRIFFFWKIMKKKNK